MWIELCGNIWSFKIISRLNVVKAWTSLENSDQWARVRKLSPLAKIVPWYLVYNQFLDPVIIDWS